MRGLLFFIILSGIISFKSLANEGESPSHSSTATVNPPSNSINHKSIPSGTRSERISVNQELERQFFCDHHFPEDAPNRPAWTELYVIDTDGTYKPIRVDGTGCTYARRLEMIRKGRKSTIDESTIGPFIGKDLLFEYENDVLIEAHAIMRTTREQYYAMPMGINRSMGIYWRQSSFADVRLSQIHIRHGYPRNDIQISRRLENEELEKVISGSKPMMTYMSTFERRIKLRIAEALTAGYHTARFLRGPGGELLEAYAVTESGTMYSLNIRSGEDWSIPPASQIQAPYEPEEQAKK